MDKKRIFGITLSGGGVRGIAHLGVLQALNEHGISPDRLSGSSAGAIVAIMYAKGFSPKEILDIIIKTNYFRFLRPAISLRGLLKMESVYSLYKEYLKEDDFGSLQIPVTIAATDVHLAKTVFFSEGEIIRPLMASSCIPGMFDPILIEGHHYVDGGVLNNLPVEPLLGKCDRLMGVNCNHLPVQQNISHIKSLIERTVIMSMNYNVYSRVPKCDYFVEPKGLATYGVLEIKKAKEIFARGYEYMMEFYDLHSELNMFQTNTSYKDDEVVG
ncbi:patatin-like phospholipase family protein [Lunatimonas salinarum]|uniref:patatin-like phospholipase family protein n=1 Tax=Lunatimonas salinarum TaxID=1774590 RepID=UPI003CC91B17